MQKLCWWFCWTFNYRMGITVGKEFDSKYDDNLLTKVKGLLNIILQGNNEEISYL